MFEKNVVFSVDESPEKYPFMRVKLVADNQHTLDEAVKLFEDGMKSRLQLTLPTHCCMFDDCENHN